MKYRLERTKDGVIHRRKLRLLHCGFCNNDFWGVINKKAKVQSCSAKCAHDAKRNRTKVECATCGKEISRTPSKLLGARHGFYFCSRVCKEKAQSIGGIKEIQPDHYKDGVHSYRSVAFRNKAMVCERCGYDEYVEVLQVHHKDRDRKNNELENLEVLCPTCHVVEHFKNNDGIFHWKAE